MKFRVLWILFAVLIAGPAFAQKIYIDYDKDYDGSKNKTFAWSPKEEATLAATDPLLHSKIIDTLVDDAVWLNPQKHPQIDMQLDERLGL